MTKYIWPISIASFAFLLYITFVGIVGYQIGILEAGQEIHKTSQIIYPFFLSIIVLGFTFFNYFINIRIEEESLKAFDKNEKRFVERVKSNSILCFEKLDMVERSLKNKNISGFNELVKPIHQAKVKFQKYLDHYSAAQVMVRFLRYKSFHVELAKEILSEVEKKYQKKDGSLEIYSSPFPKNINCCLNWLLRSLEHLEYFSIAKGEESLLISALSSRTNGVKFEMYVYALQIALIYCLESDNKRISKEFKSFCMNEDISEFHVIELVEDYVKHLLSQLESLDVVKKANKHS